MRKSGSLMILYALAAASFAQMQPTTEPRQPANAPSEPARSAPVQTPLPGAPPAGVQASWRTLEVELDKRPFQTGLAAFEVQPGGALKPLYGRWADRRMSIGTCAMIFVHSVVLAKASGGVIPWESPIALDLHYTSWPRSPILDMPEGTNLTLADWTRRMMLANENTAAEHLIAILGRENVEAEVRRIREIAGGFEAGGAGAVEPFLTPGEFWRLKASFLSEPLECYAWSGEEERRTILATQVAGMDVSEMVAGNWVGPQFIDQVGWFASPRELCVVASEILDRSADRAMRPAREAWRLPGVEKGNQKWRRVWGKLGGEPGVLAGVWAIETATGRVFILSMVFNDSISPIPEATTVALIRHALDALSNEM